MNDNKDQDQMGIIIPGRQHQQERKKRRRKCTMTCVHQHNTFVFIHSLVPTPRLSPLRAHHLRTRPSAPETGSASSSASSISHVLNSTRRPLCRHHSRTLSWPFFVGPTSNWQSKIILAPLSWRQSSRTCTWPCVLAMRATDSAWL